MAQKRKRQNKMKTNKTKKIAFIVLSIFLAIIFIITYLKNPGEIYDKLQKTALENTPIAVGMHILFAFSLVIGLFVKRLRNFVFPALLLVLSGTALIIAFIHQILPNVITFLLFFILTIIAFIKKELVFEFSTASLPSKIVGICSLVFSFYYLHWVKEPLFLNALIFSPLGILNCPTMLAFTGLLCFNKRPGSDLLVFFVSLATLHFGIFGIVHLGAYIDIILVISGIYLFGRLIIENSRNYSS